MKWPRVTKRLSIMDWSVLKIKRIITELNGNTLAPEKIQTGVKEGTPYNIRCPLFKQKM